MIPIDFALAKFSMNEFLAQKKKKKKLNWYVRVSSFSWFFFIANKCLEWKQNLEIYEFIFNGYQFSLQMELYVFIKWISIIVQLMIYNGDSFRILGFDRIGVNAPRNVQQI